MADGSADHRGVNIVPISEAYMHSEGVVMRGLSRERLFQNSFIDSSARSPISLGQMVLLSMAIMTETDDHFLGLGRRSVPPGQMILMFRILMGCGTVGGALNSLVRFQEMERQISIDLHSDGAETQLRVSCGDAFGGANAAFIEDFYLNTIFGVLCYFLGRRFPATAVTTRNPIQPLDTQHWSMFAPVRRGRLAALHFPTATLLEPRQGDPADDICWEILRHRIALDDSASLARDGSVSLRHLNTLALCEDLGISPATFRRRNRASGNGFRRLREETLVDASLNLLADETRSISSIAAQLGYADVRSYRRFIKGATGRTPDQLRTESRTAAMEALQPKVAAAIKDIAVRLSR
jgi:AraC-like DNA-binding protein